MSTTSYVSIGGINNIPYHTEASYEERFANELFEDNVISEANDLGEITSINDNNYSIVVNDVESSQLDTYKNNQHNFLTTNKKDK